MLFLIPRWNPSRTVLLKIKLLTQPNQTPHIIFQRMWSTISGQVQKIKCLAEDLYSQWQRPWKYILSAAPTAEKGCERSADAASCTTEEVLGLETEFFGSASIVENTESDMKSCPVNNDNSNFRVCERLLIRKGSSIHGTILEQCWSIRPPID